MTSDRVRIMFLIGSLGDARAGTEKNLLTIIEHLDRRQFEPYLVSLQDCEYLHSESSLCDIECLHVYRMFTPKMRRARKELSARMRNLGIDIVQTFWLEAHLLGGGAAHKAGIDNIISARRNLGYSYSLKEKLFLKVANRYPKRWLANSRAVADGVAKLEGLDRDRFDVIYNGVKLDQPDTGDSSLPADIVMTANLRPVKSVSTLIKAVALLLPRFPKIRVLLIGDGPQRQHLESLAAEVGVSDNMTFAGSRDDVATLLSGASIGVLTSLSEGFSNSILEYMQASLPVVATDVGGNRELVQDGVNGFLVPAENPQALADKIATLLGQPDQARVMGQQGRELVEEKFSLERMISDYQNYYLDLVAG